MMQKVLFVQSGHYTEAYLRFQAGEPETYRDQRLSVDWVETLSQTCAVTVLAVNTQDPSDVQLTPTLRSVSVGYDTLTPDWLRAFFDEVQPDRLICRQPDQRVLSIAQKRRIPTLPAFADLFSNGGARQLYRNLRLRRTLIGSHIPCVSNHSKNASLSVSKALFYPKGRVVPWDHHLVQADYPTKEGPALPSQLRLFYAGGLREIKGLGDTLEALALLPDYGVLGHLTIAGTGDLALWKARADALGIAAHVTFLGRVSNTAILEQMYAHDAVLVPSRWDYPEGLPNTIYEALAVHTPLVISDHPAFSGRLEADKECLVFRARDPEDLAQVLQRLSQDQALFTLLSQNSDAAMHRLTFGLHWDQLWTLFLEDPRSETGWVQKHSLQALGQ